MITVEFPRGSINEAAKRLLVAAKRASDRKARLVFNDVELVADATDQKITEGSIVSEYYATQRRANEHARMSVDDAQHERSFAA